MEFWSSFWAVVFTVGIALCAVLAVVVTVGGARDVRALLRNLARDEEERHRE